MKAACEQVSFKYPEYEMEKKVGCCLEGKQAVKRYVKAPQKDPKDNNRLKKDQRSAEINNGVKTSRRR